MLLVWVASAAVASAPTCEGLSSARVGAAVSSAKQLMTKTGVHAADLDAEARSNIEALASPEPCERYAAARSIEDAVRRLDVDQAFVREKYKRVAGWAHSTPVPPRTKRAVDKLLAETSAHLMAGRLPRANRSLNEAMAALFGSKALWSLPPALAAPEPAGVEPTGMVLDDAEVGAACPTAEAPEALVARLGRELDSRRLRLFDARQGEELWAEQERLRRAGKGPETARVLCVLLARLAAVQVDLGFISGRYAALRQRVTDRGRYSSLLEKASAQTAARQFAEAHATMEEIFVLAGEPAPASKGLR